MRALLRPVLMRALRRSPEEITARARAFRIHTQDGWDLVNGVAEAFMGGFNAMIESPRLEDVAARGSRVGPHFRPFYFEGAAMGYLPRRLVRAGVSAARAERDLLAMDPGHRYLYYVGIGFWKSFVSRGPRSLSRLDRHLDPMYAPLCLDGYGFSTAFYGAGANQRRIARLAGQLDDERAVPFWQGVGRGLYFVFLEDPAGFQRCAASFPADRGQDLEFGRSLALGFTRADRPARLLEHIDPDSAGAMRDARLGGITWALTARRMTDAAYFERCAAEADPAGRRLLAELPRVCEKALSESRGYLEWQRRTIEAVRVLTLPAASPRWGGATPSR